jgi:hypothetical protein
MNAGLDLGKTSLGFDTPTCRGCKCGCSFCGSRRILPRKTRSCEIPEPCWMPISCGEAYSRICPGGTVSLRFLITNKSLSVREVRGAVSGPAAVQVDFDPISLSLGPMERGIIAATMKAPSNASPATVYEAIVWIRGCRDYYLRWIVKIANRSDCSADEIDIVDEADYVHHWYDHFYCRRPCNDDGE